MSLCLRAALVGAAVVPAAGCFFTDSINDRPVAKITRIDDEAPYKGIPIGFDAAKSYRDIREQFESDFERRYVSWLLDRHAGNISAAAREAKMDRKHLYDLARKHGLRGDRG